MIEQLMHVKILLPYRVFADVENVKRLVVETSEGSYGLLPQRLDCCAAVAPGILAYETATGQEKYIAVDEGIMVKTGPLVLISVRNAIGDAPLGKLKELVVSKLKQKDDEEINFRSVMAKLESSFIRSIEKLKE